MALPRAQHAHLKFVSLFTRFLLHLSALLDFLSSSVQPPFFIFSKLSPSLNNSSLVQSYFFPHALLVLHPSFSGQRHVCKLNTNFHAKLPHTVKSRYNRFQGTGDNYPLLPKPVIAKMTMVDFFLREKNNQKDPSFSSTKATKSYSFISFAFCLKKY